jgi:hypothetical protein
MDTAAMVNIDVATGTDLVRQLESAKLKLNVALWAVLSEYGDWRLIVASRQLDSLDLRDAYGKLHDTLSAAGYTSRTTPPIVIIPMSDPFVRALRRYFAKTKDVEGMRLGGQLFGDRFVEDAYVYRVS